MDLPHRLPVSLSDGRHVLVPPELSIMVTLLLLLVDGRLTSESCRNNGRHPFLCRMISQEYEMSEVLEAVRFIHPHASLHSVGQLVEQINEHKRWGWKSIHVIYSSFLLHILACKLTMYV